VQGRGRGKSKGLEGERGGTIPVDDAVTAWTQQVELTRGVGEERSGKRLGKPGRVSSVELGVFAASAGLSGLVA
jgi:hypothetical protein